ncbi:MAG: LytTR family DNA-binding domain-containing protein [Bacteroidota bacterium]
MSTLKTIVVDDDRFQLEVVSSFVKKTNFLELDESFEDPIAALDSIISNSPDLLLLDIEMPELSGFDLIKSIKNPPQTIIITGKKDYAAEAYESDAIDYLVKPVDDYSRFLKAVSKAKENHVPRESEKLSDQIYVREDSLLVSINVSDIMFFEAFGDYVKVGTINKVYVIHSTLTKIEKRLTDEFVRVHRSFIVRLNKILNIDQGNLQIGEKIIPISQSMRPVLMSRIETL